LLLWPWWFTSQEALDLELALTNASGFVSAQLGADNVTTAESDLGGTFASATGLGHNASDAALSP
jgi:hypothetical protein